jgi:hypothetical protein
LFDYIRRAMPFMAPRVEMPNRNGFIPDPRPELFK